MLLTWFFRCFFQPCLQEFSNPMPEIFPEEGGNEEGGNNTAPTTTTAPMCTAPVHGRRQGWGDRKVRPTDAHYAIQVALHVFNARFCGVSVLLT